MCKFIMRPLSVVSPLWLAALSGSAWASTLTIQVEPHKTVVILLEPIILTTTVYNGGSEPVEIFQQNTPTLAHSQPCVVELRFSSDGELFKRWDDRLRVNRKAEPVSIPAGKSVAVDLVMLFNSRDGFFAENPGKYWISGRIVTTDDLEVLAPPVEIEVRGPSRADQSVWEWLNDHKEEYGRLVQVPWEAKLSDEFVKECGRICTATSSAFGEYLAYFLSRWYREGPQKDAQQSARFAEIAKVKASSEKIRAEIEKLLPHDQPESTP